MNTPEYRSKMNELTDVRGRQWVRWVLIAGGAVLFLLLSDFSIGSNQVAVLLGALIGASGSIGTLYLKRRQENRHLRIALRSEILSMASAIDQHAQRLDEEHPHPQLRIPPDTIVNTVYTNNTDKIGMLSHSEVEKITDFYSQCELVQRRIESCSGVQRLKLGTAMAFRRDYILLQIKMKEALREIEDNLDKYDGSTVPFAYLEYPDDDLPEDALRFIDVEESDE